MGLQTESRSLKVDPESEAKDPGILWLHRVIGPISSLSLPLSLSSFSLSLSHSLSFSLSIFLSIISLSLSLSPISPFLSLSIYYLCAAIARRHGLG